MKCKTVKREFWRIQWILLTLFTLCFISCKDDNDQQVAPYDPGKPVEITDFTPDTGGGDTYVVVYGKNFGTDVSLLNLTVGGKKAIVINALGDCLYAIVPQQAFKGNFVLTVGEGEQSQTVEAEKKFHYVRQKVVSTLCGKKNDRGDYEVKDGPFDDCGGFERASWLSFDPMDKNILYLAQDNENGELPIRVLDLKNKHLYTSNELKRHRFRTITWALGKSANGQNIDRDTMIISSDRGENDPSNYYVIRDKSKPAYQMFDKSPSTLTTGTSGCNGSDIHPENGELYYGSFAQGDVYRFDYRNAWNGSGYDANKREHLFTIQDRSWEFNIVIHPTGKYAYIVVVNQHYIMRTDYDWDKKKFGTPYLFCGQVGASAWHDGVGNSARLGRPYQGVFVKNKKYEGQSDEYDFYFTEKDNHCIRILTPDGNVTTFAGRGSSALNGEPYGNIDGALREKARFDQPAGLAYDEENEVFYVGDTMNRSIRMIAMEEGEDESVVDDDNENN